MTGFSANQQAFLDYLKANSPRLYQVAMNTAKRVAGAQGMAGMGDIDWSGMFSKITDAVSKAAPAVLEYKQQRDLMKAQVERAKQNMPPIDASAYAVRPSIGPQYQPGMSTGPSSRGGARSPQTMQTFEPMPAYYETGAKAKNIGLWLAGGAVALLGLLFVMRKR